MAYIANTPTRELIEFAKRLEGTWHGNYAMCVCPAHADHTPSLSLRQGDRGILVHCFANCERETILAALGNPDIPGQVCENEISPQDFSTYARAIWDESSDTAKTIAETYQRARALPLDLPDIRFHPNCPRQGGSREPALIAGLRERHEIICIHRIFLRVDGSWHTGKQMLGRPKNSAWRSAMPTTQLGLAEGVEDAAAFYKWTGIPCWSGLSSSNLANVAIPHHVEQLYVPYDEGLAGRKALQRLTELHGHSCEVIPVSPKPCNDWAAKGLWLEKRGRGEASNGGASDDNFNTPNDDP